MNLTIESGARDHWLSERAKGITGTDAASIMGASPYKSNVDLWLEKTRRKEPKEIDSDLVQYGRAAEKPLIELFKLDFPEFEVSHADFDLRVHKEHDWLRGSIDGELFEKETAKRGVLEIKTAQIQNGAQLNKWRDAIPENYFWQVCHYLLVTEYEFCVLKAQLKFRDGKIETRHYRLDRKDAGEQLETLFAEEKKFWDFVQADKEPPLVLPKI